MLVGFIGDQALFMGLFFRCLKEFALCAFHAGKWLEQMQVRRLHMKKVRCVRKRRERNYPAKRLQMNGVDYV